MKILHMNPAFYPATAYGGTVEVAYRLTTKLSQRGHDVTVCTSDALDKENRNPSCNFVIDGVQVHYFKSVSNFLNWRRFVITPSMICKLGEFIKNVDIVHLHGSRNFQNIIAHYYALKYGVPYVLQAHGSLVTFFQKGILKKVFDVLWGRRVLQHASKVIALNSIEANQYIAMGVPEDKIEILPNGIDLSEFEVLPQKGTFRVKWGINNEQKIILFLARINKIKGLDILIEAFSKVTSEIPNTRLIIAGPDDGYLEKTKERVTHLGIKDNVVFTGPLYGQDKLEAFVDGEIYVLPSSYEIFSISAIEACACGTPVIVTDRCGIASEISNSNAGIVVPYDANALRDALIKYFNTGKDIRNQYSHNGRTLTQNRFDWNNIVKELEIIYLKVVGQ